MRTRLDFLFLGVFGFLFPERAISWVTELGLKIAEEALET